MALRPPPPAGSSGRPNIECSGPRDASCSTPRSATTRTPPRTGAGFRRSASPASGTPTISEFSRRLRFSEPTGSRYFTSAISAGWFLEPLLKGFAKLVQREGLGPDKAALVLAGTPPEEDLRHASSLGIADYVESRPRYPLPRGARGDAQCGCAGAGDGGRHGPHGTRQTLRFLAARRPILAITDQPEPGRIVDQTGAGVVVPPANPEAIAAGLVRLRARCQAPDRGEIPAESVTAFDAAEQARRFASVLEAAIAR